MQFLLFGKRVKAWEEYLYCQVHDADDLEKINELINKIKRTPFKGKGKPETLR